MKIPSHVAAVFLLLGCFGLALPAAGHWRRLQVVRLSSDAVSDSPTLGAFGGVRIGRGDFGISPQLAIFYDRSALDLRRSNLLIVPSFTFHGARLSRFARFFPLLGF